MSNTPSPASITFRIDTLATPIGEMLCVQDAQQRLRALDWREYEERLRAGLEREHGEGKVHLRPGDGSGPVVAAIERYLAGDVRAIDALAVAAPGTAFQQRVWAALRRIPGGQTLSYGQLAARIGKPKAVRAVGLANRANPVGVVVPCHRVIGADGRLTGYGAGVERKRWLLRHEGVAV